MVKSGSDRVILADSATGKAVVIIGLDEYERLSGTGTTTAVMQTAPHAAEPAAAPVEPILQARPAFAYAPAAAPVPAPVPHMVEPRVEAPAKAPEIVPKTPVGGINKYAVQSDNPFKKKAMQLGVVTAPVSSAERDLTQAELLDKINRDIGDWKTAQERKRAQELTSVARSAPRPEPESPVEEEERFYLEPIE